MSRRRGQTPRSGNRGGVGRRGRGPTPGPNDAIESGRPSFIERMRVPERVSAAAPRGMRTDSHQRGARRKKGQRPSITRIMVIAVMMFLALALGLSGLIAFLPPPGSGG